MCILTRDAADALHRAQQELLTEGYTLKVYDCYRPQRAVNDFVAWAKDLQDQRMKAEFYPRVDKSTLFADGYIAQKSGHSRGSTMDLTVVRLPAEETPHYTPGQPLTDCAAPQLERFPDNTIDMGTGFDCFDTLALTRWTRGSRANSSRTGYCSEMHLSARAWRTTRTSGGTTPSSLRPTRRRTSTFPSTARRSLCARPQNHQKPCNKRQRDIGKTYDARRHPPHRNFRPNSDGDAESSTVA